MKTSDSTSATMTTTSLFAGTTASAGVPSSVTSTTNNHPASPVTTADGLDTGTPDLEVTFHPRHYRPGRLSLRQQRDKCTPCSSNSSKSVIEICDSEDEEMSRAIEASLNDSQSLRKEKNTTSIEQVLKEYRDGAVKKDFFRSRVLESTFRAITRKSFNPNGQLYVKFSGEMGEDYGGPRREFFRTLAETTEFTRGLNDVGHLWEVVTRHRELFKPIFCHKPTGLTKDVVYGLCKIEFSEPGKIEIMFYDQEDGVTRLPSVSTCGLQMWLPRGVGEPDTLSSFIQTDVKGFHKISCPNKK
ncbi:hypothetical protein MAR_005407 [Mya arenaria]|uniref:HECT domain-containing protein n=1 Tax=Mya arenaria TaxID=6604 RepID=A0ABY7F145_MYAAR|nr:hypothetical protein MAR_005407 [Mya arenaria]